MHRILTAGAAALLLGVAACSSSGGPHPPAGRPSLRAHGSTTHTTATSGGCAGDVTAQICVTVGITGAATVTGTGRTTAPEPVEAEPSWTCHKIASFSGGEYNLGDALQSVAGHNLRWDASLGAYHGPGTYALTGTEFYINVDDKSYMAAGSNGTASVTIAPDLSVTFRFDGLQDSGTNGRISGTLRWTCGDPR